MKLGRGRDDFLEHHACRDARVRDIARSLVLMDVSVVVTRLDRARPSAHADDTMRTIDELYPSAR